MKKSETQLKKFLANVKKAGVFDEFVEALLSINWEDILLKDNKRDESTDDSEIEDK